MRVTFLLPSYPFAPVGGFRVVYEYANQLVRRGHQVTVVHPLQLGTLPRHPYKLVRRLAGLVGRRVLGPPKIRWHRIDPRVEMVFVPSLGARYVPDGDAVVATWWETAEVMSRYPLSKGVQFHLIQHYETWGGLRERVDAAWRLPTRKVVIARWLYEKGIELGVPGSEMRHIPNGIDHERYRLLNPIAARPKRVCMLYHPAEWKGAVDGLKALERARSKHPDLGAVLFGTVPRPRGLPAWIEYWHDPPQDRLVLDIYNGSAVYLCPSWTEGWALPPAEAMACGCAVVSTDNGGVRDYASDGHTALLAPPRRPDALAAQLLRVLDDDVLRQRLARAGVEQISRFTWERSTALLEEWLTEGTSRTSETTRQ